MGNKNGKYKWEVFFYPDFRYYMGMILHIIEYSKYGLFPITRRTGYLLCMLAFFVIEI